MYVSFDDGDHWQPLQANLPVTSVRDIDVHGDDVVAGTHGRGFWILDDVAPLRQAGAAAAAGAKPYLFAPSTAVRVRPAGFTGTPLPKDEPMASNPPLGAYVDYVIPSRAGTAPLEISIRDGAGALVRTYRSDDRLPGTDISLIRTAPEWAVAPAAPLATPGMHRFVWPLRYPAPPALADGNPYADGVWAPPGSYTVEIATGGERLRQPLTIAPDPRIGMGADAYARQFTLARRIEDAAARVAAAISVADAAQKRSAPGAAALQALLGPEFGAAPAGPPPAGITPLRVLASQVTRFLEAVDGADAPPSPDVEAAFAKLEPALAATIAAAEKLSAASAP
jgi:hypothetical protein